MAVSYLNQFTRTSSWPRAFLVLVFALGASIVSPAQATYRPSIIIGRAALISPTQANTFYGSSTTSTDGLSSLTHVATPTPPEIIALARALKNNPDLIYEYVRNNIEPVWMYGLQKGALGAEIDKSGTPFDQAALMVALLRQAGYTANYQAGTITLTGSQFTDWTAISDASAACQLLSSGSIPAVINGTTTSNCAYGTGTAISSVQLSHIWVSVVIGGAAYVFDPSYKPHTWKTGINLATATGLISGQPLAQATSGMDTGTLSGVGYVHALNQLALNAKLQTYASNLQAYLRANNLAGAHMEDVVGGGVINAYVSPSGGLRQTTLPYSSAVQHSWSGGIPDQYRTTLGTSGTVYKYSSGTFVSMFSVSFYVDQIYGRALMIDTDIENEGAGPTVRSNTITLTLDGTVLATYVNAAPTGGQTARAAPGTVTLVAGHPYAASADGTPTTHGDYMDATITKDAQFATPLTIVHGWGDTSATLLAKWTEEKATDQKLPAYKIPCDPTGGNDHCLQLHSGGQGDFDREKLAAGWLAQYTAAANLNAQIGGAVPQLHHALGLVYADVTIGAIIVSTVPNVTSMPIVDSFNRLDIDASISLTSKTANATARRAGLQAIAASAAALESSIAAQMDNLPDTSSTATRFEWANTPPGTTGSLDQAYEDPSGVGPRKFLQFTAANASSAAALMLAEGQTSTTHTGFAGTSAQPDLGNGEMQGWRQVSSTVIADYAGAGFTVVASQEGFIGPGQRAGQLQVVTSGGVPIGYYHMPTKQRGEAFVATRYDANGDPLEIAHINVQLSVDPNGLYTITKGGGGGIQPTVGTDYSPAEAADVLKTRFVDKSNAQGVNLANGTVAYASPVQLAVGTGGFPYALTGRLDWSPAPAPDKGITGPVIPTAPEPGWVSNWQNRLSLSGSGLEGMGQSDVRAAVNTIAAFFAVQDIYKAAQSNQRDVAGVLAEAWWTHRIEANVATVQLGHATRQFLASAAGQWIAPGADYAALTQTGSRVQFENICESDPSSIVPYAMSRGWNNAAVSFAVTNAAGDVQSFPYWLNPYKLDIYDQGPCGRADGFRLTSWTYPQGVVVNLVYGNPYSQGGTATIDRLVEVNNSLGRKIDFSWNNEQLTGFNNMLTSSDARSVILTWGVVGSANVVVSHSDPASAVTAFTYTANQVASATQRPLPYGQLYQVFTADNGSQANLEYTYDGTNRIQQIRDGVAIQIGGRNPWTFFIADGTRAERDDPLGAPYTVVYDTYAHPSRYIDEIGRETDTLLDGRGRVQNYTYPEGDQELLAYDERNNLLSLTRHAKPGSGLSNIVVSKTYIEGATVAFCVSPVTCNRTATQTSGRSYVTNYSWNSATGLLTQLLLPADSIGNRPETDYSYTAFGSGFKLLTGKTEKIDTTHNLTTSYTYNASNDYVALSTSVDPSGLNLTTTYTYDAQGSVTEVNGPRTDVTDVSDFTWDLDRRLIYGIQADPDGAGPHPRPTIKNTYDAVGRVIQVDTGTATGPTGAGFASTLTVTTAYDPVGNKQKVASPTQVTQFSYDGDNRPVCTTARMNPAVFGSLPTDACTLVTAGSYGPDRITKLVYDAAGQVMQELRAFGTAIQQTYATNTWTPNGKLASVYDADGATHITTYAYDGFDRPTTTTFADSTFEQVTLYDADSNLITRLNRSGQSFTMGYDALDRMTSKAVPAAGAIPANTITTAYDLKNQVTGLSDTNGNTLTNVFDVVGRLTSATRTTPSLTAKTVSYQYDQASNRTRLTWSDGYYATYAYDALNHPTTVIDSGTTTLATYLYDDLARRISLQYAGTAGAKALYSWSPENDLATLQHDYAGTTNDVSFTNTFTPAHQWATDTISNPADNFAPPALASAAYVPNTLNQYTSVEGTAQTYDTRGNLTSTGTQTYAYDAENRLMSATGTGLSAAYAYDPLGRRTTKIVNTVVTSFVHDGDTEIAEYDGSGSLLTRYVPGPTIDEVIATVTAAGTRTYFHGDKMGSVIAMSDASGSLAEGPYTYDAYGNCFSGATSCSVGVPFRFTGQRFDPETGLDYFRARYYSPALGRFLQTDPVGYGVDLNLYTYVHNDPLNNLDPLGLDTVGIGFEGSVNIPFFTASVSIGIAFDDKGGGAFLASGGGGFQVDRGTLGAAHDLLTAGSLKGAISALGGIAKGALGSLKGAARDSVGLTGQFSRSNADTVKGLAGPFQNTTVQGGVGVGGGRTTFSGNDDKGKTVTGTTYSGGLVTGASVSRTTTTTVESPVPKNPNPLPAGCNYHNPQSAACH